MAEEQRVPVLETKKLGISFGGLKAVNDFNIRHIVSVFPAGYGLVGDAQSVPQRFLGQPLFAAQLGDKISCFDWVHVISPQSIAYSILPKMSSPQTANIMSIHLYRD